MSNLTPEKRPDRNGKMVTRHVRSGGDEKPSKRLPAPALKNSQSAGFKPTAARWKPRTWDTDRWSLSRADAKLREACTKYNTSYTYDFTCSDVEAYQVMSVVTPANAVPILSAGVRTSEAAKAFLQSIGMERLIIDNSALAREALERNLSAEKLVAGYNKDLPSDADTSEHFVDALEASTMSSLNNNSGWDSAVIRLALQGRINVSDIKTIGVTRVAMLSLSETERLEALKRGDLGFDVEDFRDLIIKASEYKLSDRYTTSAILSLAQKYGAEPVLALKDPSAATQLDKTLTQLGYPEDKIVSAMKWYDELKQEYKYGMSSHDVMALHSAGVSVEEAVRGLYDDLDAQQIVGVHNGIEASISEGWL